MEQKTRAYPKIRFLGPLQMARPRLWATSSITLTALFLLSASVPLTLGKWGEATAAIDADSPSATTQATDSTYADIISQNEAVMVLYYIDWCYWSKILLPEFEQAAKLMAHQQSQVKFLLVNCATCRETAMKEGIRSFPTMKLFVDGKRTLYTGRRQRTDIINWIDDILNRDKIIDSIAALNDFWQSRTINHGLVIAAFPAEHRSAEFLPLSRRFGDMAFFGETSNKDVINYLKDVHLNVSTTNYGKDINLPFMAMWINLEGEENLALYDGSLDDLPAMIKFVQENSFPAIVQFNHFWTTKLYEDGRPLVIIRDNTESDSIVKMVREVQKEKKSFFFTIIREPATQEKHLLDHLALDDETLPLMRIVSFKEQQKSLYNTFLKYKPKTNAVTKKNLIQFTSDYSAGMLEPYVRSEPPPEIDDAKDPVKVYVGETFEKEARDSQSDILVLFHAPWCGHCHALLPAYNELGKRLKEVSNLVISKIDATRNEVRGVALMGYPTILLFPAHRKDSPIQFSGARTLESMMTWLSRNVDAAKFEPKAYLKENFLNALEQDAFYEEL